MKIAQFPIIDLKNNKFTQINKIYEESIELIRSSSLENEIEELLDVIQASLGLLNMYNQDEIDSVMIKHNEKLINRKWNILSYIDFVKNIK